MNAMIQEQQSILCSQSDLIANAGVAVRYAGQSYALFYLPQTPEKVFAIGHFDPFSQAEVLAWGLLCEGAGQWSVASPLYKQHFRLIDGQCLEDAAVSVPVLKVSLIDAQVVVV